MIGMRMPDAARWSERVSVVLGSKNEVERVVAYHAQTQADAA